MRYTIAQKRLAFGWSQTRLAAETGIPQKQISRHERRERGPSSLELQAYARAFCCSVFDLDVAPHRAEGRPSLDETHAMVARFNLAGEYDPSYGRPSITKLPSAREFYPDLMRELDAQRTCREEGFLRIAPSGSSLETVHQLLTLRGGGNPAMASPALAGFDKLPVVERDSNRAVGHIYVPAIVAHDWLMIPQVTVLTGRGRRSMDALVVVTHPRRLAFNLEIDGRGHDFRGDSFRSQDIGLPTIRLTEADVLADLPLSERLRSLPAAP